MSTQPPVTPPANPNPAPNPNPTTNPNPQEKKSDDHSNEHRIRSAAFWIIIVLVLILWLIGWLLHYCVPWIHLLPAVALAAVLVELLTGNSKNIDSQERYIPNWNPAQPEASLTKIYEYVLDEAAKSTNWYWKSKGPKALGLAGHPVFGLGSGCRGWASADHRNFLAKRRRCPVRCIHLANGLWASLLLGIAAALLGLDKGFRFFQRMGALCFDRHQYSQEPGRVPPGLDGVKGKSRKSSYRGEGRSIDRARQAVPVGCGRLSAAGDERLGDRVSEHDGADGKGRGRTAFDS